MTGERLTEAELAWLTERFGGVKETGHPKDGTLEGIIARLLAERDRIAPLVEVASDTLTEPIEQWLDDLARELAGPLGTDARVERIRSALPAAFREYREWGYAAGQAAERERIAPLVTAVKHQRRLRGGEHTLEASRAADAAVAAALADWEAHDDH